MAKASSEKLPSVIREKCGTYAGYRAHQNRKEITCQSCCDAATAHAAQWKSANPNAYKAYRARNAKRKNALARNRYAKNPKSQKEANKAWHFANREKVHVRQKQYKTEHPEKIREHSRTRRARVRGNGFSPYTEAQVHELYGYDCHICGEPIDMTAPRHTAKKGWERGLHIDHKLALANGGRDDLENARPSHGLCNQKKFTKHELPLMI